MSCRTIIVAVARPGPISANLIPKDCEQRSLSRNASTRPRRGSSRASAMLGPFRAYGWEIRRSARAIMMRPPEMSSASHRDLRPDLDHAAGRDVEEVGGVARAFREPDEQAILPARHAGARVRLERAARQEERGRHDVEDPALAARDRQRLGNVRRLHVAELER